jgi:hypothetical protein
VLAGGTLENQCRKGIVLSIPHFVSCPEKGQDLPHLTGLHPQAEILRLLNCFFYLSGFSSLAHSGIILRTVQPLHVQALLVDPLNQNANGAESGMVGGAMLWFVNVLRHAQCTQGGEPFLTHTGGENNASWLQ